MTDQRYELYRAQRNIRRERLAAFEMQQTLRALLQNVPNLTTAARLHYEQSQQQGSDGDRN